MKYGPSSDTKIHLLRIREQSQNQALKM